MSDQPPFSWRSVALGLAATAAGTVVFIGLAYLANACGVTYPKPNLARQACYLAAEAKADERVKVECAGFTWEGCPTRPQIMTELRAAQEACP